MFTKGKAGRYRVGSAWPLFFSVNHNYANASLLEYRLAWDYLNISSITVSVNQSLREGWCLNHQGNSYSTAIWGKYCNHHSWYDHSHHHSLLAFYIPVCVNLQGVVWWVTIMQKTDQSLSKTRLILRVLSHSIGPLDSWHIVLDLQYITD